MGLFDMQIVIDELFMIMCQRFSLYGFTFSFTDLFISAEFLASVAMALTKFYD